MHATPRKLGPVRVQPEIYQRLDAYLACTPEVTQRQAVEAALDSYLPPLPQEDHHAAAPIPEPQAG